MGGGFRFLAAVANITPPRHPLTPAPGRRSLGLDGLSLDDLLAKRANLGALFGVPRILKG